MLPPDERDTATEARLRATLNDAVGGMIDGLDAAMRLRTAPPEAQRTRHLVVGKLREAALLAMHALAQTRNP